MDLVIMAAGLGSRFGGLKQLESIDDDKNFILDYSIYDAIKFGFDHIVFVIKEEFFELFKSSIGNRIEKLISIDYVFQNFKNIPDSFQIPKNRIKPLGTGHAILCAKSKIKSDFVVINADDFYGYESFKIASNFLKHSVSDTNYGLVGFHAINTILSNGTVKRGICFYEKNHLLKIIESSIEKLNENKLMATDLSSNEKFTINNNRLLSMNMFAFSKKFLNYLDDYFLKFLNNNKNDLSSCEFFLPTVVSDLIEKRIINITILSTTSKWFGITYKEDLSFVKNEILKLKNKNIYPEHLWK